MTQPKTPEEWASHVRVLYQEIINDRYTVETLDDPIIKVITLAMAQARREALEEACHIAEVYSVAHWAAEKIRALIEKEAGSENT